MIVIAAFELVLDNDLRPGAIFRYKIHVESARRLFAFDIDKVEAEGTIQDVNIVLKPTGEVVRFMCPDFA